LMATQDDEPNLRDPVFLLWLMHLVGTWDLSGEVEVRQRDDGFLEARREATHKSLPLGDLIEKGAFVRPPEGPLGPRPVILSARLMHQWLPPEDLERLRGAWHVGSGMTIILNTIERCMAEMPQAERDKRWIEWWAAGALKTQKLSQREEEAHRLLYLRYRQALAAHSPDARPQDDTSLR
jgi:hypothetical protein